MSVPSTTEGNLSHGLVKKPSAAISRGTPPPVPPNKPIIPPKKDLMSFMKKSSIAENAASITDKEQKGPVLQNNSFLSSDIAASEKVEESVKN